MQLKKPFVFPSAIKRLDFENVGRFIQMEMSASDAADVDVVTITDVVDAADTVNFVDFAILLMLTFVRLQPSM